MASNIFTRLPISIALFIFTAVVFILQLFPVPGVFLMLFAAPFWSVITINLGFILMAVESMTGKLPRWAVVFPILYLTVYFCCVIFSHWQASILEANDAADQTAVHVPFDPAKNALVFGADSFFQGQIGDFVTSYGLPVVYVETPRFPPKSHLACRIYEGPACRQLEKEGAFVSYISTRDHCDVRMPEDPVLPAVTIRDSLKDQEDFIFHSYITFSVPPKKQILKSVDITISDPYGNVGHIKNSFSQDDDARLPWLPIPVFGCALNDAGPSWVCMAGFMGFPKVHYQSSDPISRIADYLGLNKRVRNYSATRSLTNEAGVISKEILKSRQNYEEDVFRDLVTNLRVTDDRLADYFISHPKLMAAEAPAMVEALDRSVRALYHHAFSSSRTKETKKARGVLMKMIAYLPKEAYMQQSASIIKILGEDEDEIAQKWDLVVYSPEFFARLGDAGPGAYDMLTNEIQVDDLPDENHLEELKVVSAALGLCRAGVDAAKTAGPGLISILNQTDRDINNPNLHSAVFVALLRLGLKDAALQDKSADQPNHKNWYDQKVSSVTPESPRSVCSTVDDYYQDRNFKKDKYFDKPLPD